MSTAVFPEELTQRISAAGVVAVLMVDDAQAAVPLAKALLDGGVDAMELTLRTPAALEALRLIKRDVPEMLAGIGTILTPEQVTDAAAAGATFGVAPGFNPRVVRQAREAGLPFAPGICTPTDIELAVEQGCRTLKFFPAEPSGGLKYLKSVAAPFIHLGVKFVPLGGVNLDNLSHYLSDDLVLAVGGSWLAPRDRIAAGDWAAIQSRAAAAKERLQQIRQGS